MSVVTPQERITPAGRYVSKLVVEMDGKPVLLVDGKNLITMHIVVRGTPALRRAERLASVATDGNRITFGCISRVAGVLQDGTHSRHTAWHESG